jgi:hypothetical protein
MDETKKILTAEGDVIHWLPKDPDNYVDKTTLIFGGSSSGKTKLIEEILYLTKEEIPNYLVCSNENSVKAYKNKLPAKCIKNDLSKKKIQKIWDRQKYVTQLYDVANDINNLEKVYNRMSDRESTVMLASINKRAADFIRAIDATNQLDYAQKKTQKTTVEEKQLKKIKEIYKDAIRKNRKKLLELSNLTGDEKVTIKYIDLNPRIMLIIDDCTDKFEQWMSYFKKNEVNPFNSIFYQGRHNYITLVFAAHDDKVVDTKLRKNARTTIYTNSQSLMASLGKKGNGYTKAEIKKAERMAARLFGGEEHGLKTYQKLCYVREDTQPFRYTIANLYPEFELGGDAFLKLANKMPVCKDKLTENPFAKEFMEEKNKLHDHFF